MGQILNVNENKIDIERISFKNDTLYDKKWIIKLHIDINKFKYVNEKRIEGENKPKFIFENEEDKKIIFEKDEKIKDGIAFKFKAVYHNNFVHRYKLQLINEKNEIV